MRQLSLMGGWGNQFNFEHNAKRNVVERNVVDLADRRVTQ